MEKRFMTTSEVAEFLRIRVKTLQNMMSKHEVYRPGRQGIWHVEHVKILEKVWAGALSEDEGAAFWRLEKYRMHCEAEKMESKMRERQCRFTVK